MPSATQAVLISLRSNSNSDVPFFQWLRYKAVIKRIFWSMAKKAKSANRKWTSTSAWGSKSQAGRERAIGGAALRAAR